MNITLGELKKILNETDSEFDNCIVDISYDSGSLGIINLNGELLQDIQIFREEE